MVESMRSGKQLMTEDKGKGEVKDKFKKIRLSKWKNNSAVKRIQEIKEKD